MIKSIITLITLAFLLVGCSLTIAPYPDISEVLSAPIPEQPADMPDQVYDSFSQDIENSKHNIAEETDIYESYITLGNAFKALEKPEMAYSCFDYAGKTVDSTNIVAHLNKGSILEEMGKYEEAAEAYRTALSIRPTVQAYFRLGIILNQHLNASQEEVMAHYDEAIKNAQYEASLTETYLIYLVENDLIEKADQVVKDALTAMPDNERYLEIQESYDNL